MMFSAKVSRSLVDYSDHDDDSDSSAFSVRLEEHEVDKAPLLSISIAVRIISLFHFVNLPGVSINFKT